MAGQFFDSVFKYTDPVRYFKANDPYYYEVDNIPLKQLQENCNFLKDQVANLIKPEQIQSLGRANFSELQPYVEGNDNILRVRPGRYSARINDAYNIDAFQKLTQIDGFTIAQSNKYSVKTNRDAEIKSILNKFKTYISSNATNMNGLFERSFTFPVTDLDGRSSYLLSGSPGYRSTQLIFGSDTPFPNLSGVFPAYNTNASSLIATTFTDLFGGMGLPALESEFIKRWRGITRTSIVDIPEELTIEIPPFNEEDFYYIDETGQRVNLIANQRIDLLFIYSKPIDASSATISRYSNNVPSKINAATLGIVRGAGIGVNLKTTTNSAPKTGVRIVDSEGNPMILPNISDELALDTGFTTSAGTIRGSFPSPDDLLNLTPLISENLESNSFALIGQSILPIAYILVKKNASVNTSLTNILTADDVIDIRPFFRTTELSYNERSGLAAATPPASLANPVVTENYVDEVSKQINQQITALDSRVNSLPIQPKIIAAGYVQGGTSWGVEGTLKSFIKRKYFPGLTDQQLIGKVKEIYDYPGDLPLSELPDWDIANWADSTGLFAGGQFPHDYINFAVRKADDYNFAGYGYDYQAEGQIGISGVGELFSTYPVLGGQYQVQGTSTSPGTGGGGGNIIQRRKRKLGRFARKLRRALDPFGNSVGTGGGTAPSPVAATDVTTSTIGGFVSFYWVKKTIRIDKSQVDSWMEDYRVNVKLHNCVPLSHKNDYETAGLGAGAAGISNVWISKANIEGSYEFTIFVAWNAIDATVQPDTATSAAVTPYLYRQPTRNSRGSIISFNGFAVITKEIAEDFNTDFLDEDDVYGNSAVGATLYPTVTFEVVGIPRGYGASTSLSQKLPVLTLK